MALFNKKTLTEQQEDILEKVKELNQKRKQTENSYEKRVLENPDDAAIAASGFGLVGGIMASAFAYTRNLGFPGKREQLITDFLQQNPDKLQIAYDMFKTKNFDNVVSYLNLELLNAADVTKATGLQGLYDSLTMLTVGEAVLTGAILASFPFVYYCTKKHFYEKKMRKYEDEISKLSGVKSPAISQQKENVK